MKHKVGDLVFVCTDDDIFYDAIINRSPMRITGITDDRYILEKELCVDESDIYSINVVINNLQHLVSKSKKQLKFVKNLKELERNRNET